MRVLGIEQVFGDELLLAKFVVPEGMRIDVLMGATASTATFVARFGPGAKFTLSADLAQVRESVDATPRHCFAAQSVNPTQLCHVDGIRQGAVSHPDEVVLYEDVGVWLVPKQNA